MVVDGDFYESAIQHGRRIFPSVSITQVEKTLALFLREACKAKESITISQLNFSHVHPLYDVAAKRDEVSRNPVEATEYGNLSPGDIATSILLSKLLPETLFTISAVTYSDYSYNLQFINGRVSNSKSTELSRLSGTKVVCQQIDQLMENLKAEIKRLNRDYDAFEALSRELLAESF